MKDTTNQKGNEMNGTEKQIEWAERIKSAVMRICGESVPLAVEFLRAKPSDAAHLDADRIERLVAMVEADNNDAGYWIDNFKNVAPARPAFAGREVGPLDHKQAAKALAEMVKSARKSAAIAANDRDALVAACAL